MRCGKEYIVFSDFNPRSPHGERRESEKGFGKATNFNPRSPHGERQVAEASDRQLSHFNPRSPHGERRWMVNFVRHNLCISIHAPRTGSDIERRFFGCVGKFQSTLPARGATRPRDVPGGLRRISIHAPRTGSDTSSSTPLRGARNFNPRSPHGERLRKVTILSIRIIGFAQKVYHKTVLLRISLAENAVILPEKPRNPVRTSLQKAGGLRFARAIRAARPYSISSPSGA